MSDPHAWFRARLEAHFLGLLEDDERPRFEEHASSCARCGAALKAFGDHLPAERSEHIPARMLARWERARRGLRGAARRLVREHLESCPACRQDLEALGFTPVLEEDAELEEAPRQGEGAAHAIEDEAAVVVPPAPPRHPIVIVQRPAPASRRAWFLGAAGGAALAAAFLLVVVPGVTRVPTSEVPSQPTPPPPVIETPISPAPPSGATEPMLSVLGRPTALSGPTRGAAPPAGMIRIDDDTRFVHVTLPDLYLPDSTRLAIEVHGPEGLVTRGEALHGELARGRTLLIGNPGRRLKPGLYRLAIRPAADTAAAPVELELRLETAR